MSLPEQWIKLAPKPRDLIGSDQWNVFLSYRSVNRSWVLNLYDVLRQQGHKVFLDQCVLKVGDELITRLEGALGTSQAGVLVWSTATRDSDWVRREYQVLEKLANQKKGFQFVPIRLDQTEIPLFAENRIFLDFSSYPDGPNGGELLRLLYAVVGLPLSEEAAQFASQQDEVAKNCAAIIGAAIRNGNHARLLDLFEKGGLAWETSSALGSQVADGLAKLDRNDEAIAVLEQLETRFPQAIRPRQLRALALARRGRGEDLDVAQEILGQLYQHGHRDPETLGIYGRTWMDRYTHSGDLSDLQQSRDLYVQAFEGAQDDYYTGINAATKCVFLGSDDDLERAGKYADRVQQILTKEPLPHNYWVTATEAELALIRAKYQEAGKLYEAAVATERKATGNHKTTWKQACRLMAKLHPSPEDRASIRNAFKHLPDYDQV